MASLAIEPGVVELIETLTTSGGVEIDIEEVVVSPTSLLVGKTLAETQTTLRSGAMIVALKEPSGLIFNQRKIPLTFPHDGGILDDSVHNSQRSK